MTSIMAREDPRPPARRRGAGRTARRGARPGARDGTPRRRLLAVGLACVVALAARPHPANAQAPAVPAPGEDAPGYGRHRWEEDYGFLRDPARRTDVWDAVKYLPLTADGDAYLSLGGDLRERYEFFDDPDFGLNGPGEDDYLLHRLLLHAALRLGRTFRTFVQVGNHLKLGEDSGLAPTDENHLDLQQGFADLAADLAGGTATLRAGRQEIAFGSQRLVSVRESPNIRRSFDGFRAGWATGDLRIDAFATRPVELDRGTFDDEPDDAQGFWGVYGTAPLTPSAGLDLYYLGLTRDDGEFDQGTEGEHRHTLGARLFGDAGVWDWDFEAALQVRRLRRRAGLRLDGRVGHRVHARGPAKEEWARGHFDTVPGDEEEFIPLPETRNAARRATGGVHYP